LLKNAKDWARNSLNVREMRESKQRRRAGNVRARRKKEG
jgi:hypothetical protein